MVFLWVHLKRNEEGFIRKPNRQTTKLPSTMLRKTEDKESKLLGYIQYIKKND